MLDAIVSVPAIIVGSLAIIGIMVFTAADRMRFKRRLIVLGTCLALVFAAYFVTRWRELTEFVWLVAGGVGALSWIYASPSRGPGRRLIDGDWLLSKILGRGQTDGARPGRHTAGSE
jgi:peptidoglycan/LPS O-acetylase OafA/YrhL